MKQLARYLYVVQKTVSICCKFFSQIYQVRLLVRGETTVQQDLSWNRWLGSLAGRITLCYCYSEKIQLSADRYICSSSARY